MKWRGINRNAPKAEMPEGFGIDAKNGVNSKYTGAATNEGGFIVWQKANTITRQKYGLPFTLPSGFSYVRRTIGEVELDLNRFLVLSIGYFTNTTDGLDAQFSEVGIVTDGEYTTVINDLLFSAPNKLGFTANHPYTGEYTKTYLNELVVAITDNNATPYYINVDYYLGSVTAGVSALGTVATFNINEIKMFPDINQIQTETTVKDTGGTVENGAYTFVYKYVNEDLSVTNPTLTSQPTFVYNTTKGNTQASFNNVEGDLVLLNTGKSITLVLSNVNTAFNEIIIYAIIKRNGVTKAVELTTIPIISSVMTTTITSSDGTDVSLSELLVPRATFKKVYKFAQVYNRLYSARPTYNIIRDYQRYANLITLKWISQIATPFSDGISLDAGFDKRTFIHKEVYAINIHLVLMDGSVTEGFHIPWNWKTDAGINSAHFRDISTRGVEQGLSLKKFQLEDTCETTFSSNASAIGKTGFWENQDETYPNLPEYDSSSLGGQNLKGQKVRHHRMPSICYMAATYTAANTAYGKTQLDQLGLVAENVIIPNDLKPFVKSWFLSFAERSPNDSTVIGQSTISFASSCVVYDVAIENYLDNIKTVWSSGLNNTFQTGAYPVEPVTPYTINKRIELTCEETILRFYDLNLLTNQPDIAPMYISNELFYDVGVDYFNHDNSGGGTNKTKGSFVSNYISGRVSPAEAPDVYLPNNVISGLDTQYRKVSDYRYLANQVIDGRYDNKIQEDCLLLNIDSTLDIGAIIPTGATIGSNVTFSAFPPASSQSGSYWMAIDTGSLYLSDGTSWILKGNRRRGLRSLPVNKNNQVIAWGDSSPWTNIRNQTYLTTLMANPNNLYRLLTQKLVSTGKITDATVSSCFTFNGDGFVTVNSYHSGGWGGTLSNNLYDPTDDPTTGVHALSVHLTISQINNQLRSSDSTNVNKQFYPKYGDYFTNTRRDVIETNKLYNNDYSSINNFVALQPYNPTKQVVQENYYRINRTTPATSESSDINWRTWLINDYYEAPRNKGKIINIEGQDRDLIIQMEKATFKTVGNEQLNIDKTTAFVGAGNIFERPAIEFTPSREGTFGTQHLHSCKLTRYGYISVDAEACRISIIAGNQPVHISDDTMYRWLVENLEVDSKVYYGPTLYIDTYSDNPYFGKGIHVGVDYEFDRILITKKDYEFTEIGRNTVLAGLLTYNSGRWLLQDFNTNDFTEITEASTAYFKDLSWTLVYEIDSKAFTFFQSYTPNKFMNARFDSFAFVTKQLAPYQSAISRLFLMNQPNKGLYDNTVNVDIDNPVTETGVPYDFYIVPVFGFGKKTGELINVQLQNEVVDTNELLGSIATYPQQTASAVLVFNSFQSTDVTDLIPFGNDMANYFLYNIRNIKGIWHFNKIYDLLDTANYNSGVPFINNFSELDSSKLNLAKAFYNKLPLIDTWFAVKIIYTNSLQNTKEFRILQVDISALPVQR
jgi:hypothetical protein